MLMQCRRFLVEGRVQGVGFRVATRSQARALSLTGFVRNLDDGRVEVAACGPAAMLARLESWLAQGPAGARVVSVISETLDALPGDHDPFAIC
ncbi:MAG: acylphosphatase [Acidiferrobacteraceae bacterium]